MKALSIRQPWAHAILHLGKEIENRRWNTSFRGEFLIHASKGMTRAEYEDGLDFITDAIEGTGLPALPGASALHRGGIVGVARLVEVISPCEYCEHLWHMPGQFGFVLHDVRPTNFVPMGGSLGFFAVPEELAARAMQGVP